jgi:lysophospholipase L1-like esterase
MSFLREFNPETTRREAVRLEATAARGNGQLGCIYPGGTRPSQEVTMRPIRIPRLPSRLRLALAVTVAAVLTACSGQAAPHQTADAETVTPPDATYYLALGDSLSQGVQPNAAGVSVKTSDGYPDQVYAVLRRTHPGLELVKLGCPGETTSTMIHGGICHYQAGSQLAAAAAFLQAHRGRVLLVTLDIGANDPEACAGQPGLSQLARCAVTGIPDAVTRLGTIMTRLTAAAGPGVRIVGMNYYLPALAEWHNGLPGRLVARTAEKLAAVYNQLLDRVYTSSGARVANVFGAFETSDFSRHSGDVPRNVAVLCQWTWACAAPPRGPNQHANQAGYQVIARTFLHASGLT